MHSTTPRKMKVLVIDDSQGILFVMQKALELKKYEVEVAESFAGVHTIEKSAPDLIFLDVSLVGKDGCAISQELKKNAGTKDIPIIILTGHPSAHELAVKAGANDYLLKPFNLVELWEKAALYTNAPSVTHPAQQARA